VDGRYSKEYYATHRKEFAARKQAYRARLKRLRFNASTPSAHVEDWGHYMARIVEDAYTMGSAEEFTNYYRWQRGQLYTEAQALTKSFRHMDDWWKEGNP